MANLAENLKLQNIKAFLQFAFCSGCLFCSVPVLFCGIQSNASQLSISQHKTKTFVLPAKSPICAMTSAVWRLCHRNHKVQSGKRPLALWHIIDKVDVQWSVECSSEFYSRSALACLQKLNHYIHKSASPSNLYSSSAMAAQLSTQTSTATTTTIKKIKSHVTNNLFNVWYVLFNKCALD